ncbi:hypothetical protein N7475_005896 [Penicillium sp. IBT 31633x]|nr:hypothetical protein N7475_005896 [Penicillium sp. IBT 31633x]
MRFSTATVFTALAALATAYTNPDYTKGPSGNPILSPGLNEIVPEGETYTIKWQPTTTGPVSLVLLRGPSENVVPLKTLAESIPNSGEFKWTPGSDLEADITHYGLLLVVEGTGQYQYSTQFGISAPAGSGSSSSSVIIETTETAAPTAPPAATTTVEVTESTTFCPESESATVPAVSSTPVAPVPVSTTQVESIEVTTTICPETETAPIPVPTSSVPRVTPTGGSPVGPPTSRPWTSIRLTPSAAPTGTASATPATSSPAYTGAAGRNVISLGAIMAGVLAAFAL